VSQDAVSSAMFMVQQEVPNQMLVPCSFGLLSFQNCELNKLLLFINQNQKERVIGGEFDQNTLCAHMAIS
jgi:hypothetical protein